MTCPAQTKNTPWQESGERIGFLFLVSIAFAALADYLFWKAPRGWTAGGYGLLLMAVLCLIRNPFASSGRLAPLLIGGVALLGLQCVEEPHYLAQALMVVGICSLAVVPEGALRRNCLAWCRGTAGLLRDIVISFPGALLRRVGRAGVGLGLGRGFINWLLPVTIGVVFLLIFTVANPILRLWWVRLWRRLNHIGQNLPPWQRVLLWVVALCWTWALFRPRREKESETSSKAAEVAVESTPLVPVGILVRCLLVANAVFALQTILDLCYLWGGAALPENLTYAQYARRGAYPLVAAAILAGLFTLVSFPVRGSHSTFRWPRRLVYVWLSQTLLLVVSAVWRLYLYVEVYTLTRLRTAAGIWMLLVFAGLVWIWIRVFRQRTNRWLLNANALTLLAVLYVCAFMNFDGFIARFNVSHCREISGSGPDIDLRYLGRLGPEALPAAARLVGKIADAPKQIKLQQTLRALEDRLDHQLRDWRGWALRRARLRRLAGKLDPGVPVGKPQGVR